MLTDLMADLILTAGNIITINPACPRAEAVAVKNGRIQAVGSAADMEQLRGRQTEVINLKGRTVVPGFNDAHNHMISFGLKLQMVLLDYPRVKTIQDLIQALKTRAATQKPDSWIRGAGYDNNKLPGGHHPTRWELDQVSTDHYIVLQHTSGHMCTVNSKALALLGIDKNTPDPEGGHIDRDAKGEATGLLEEKAQNLVSSQFFPLATASIVDALGAASSQYLKEGITSQGEAGIGMLSHLELLGYQEAVRQGKLKIRSNLMILAETLLDIETGEGQPFFGFHHGIRTGWGDDMLRIGPMKMFFDGSLIGKTAAVTQGYADDPDKLGFYAESEEKIRDWIMKGHRSGWQLAIHAIGDRAIGFILDCYEEALTDLPKTDHRHRIEHCGVLTPALIDRIRKLGVIPVPQQHFIGELGDGFKRVLGPERTRWCYPQRSMLDLGIPIPGSSDRFVVQGAPLLGIHDAVNQKTDSGADYVPEEKITPEEAIRLYTLNSAHAVFDEQIKGSIQTGKLADFTILGADPTTIAPEEIAEIPVQGTIVGGNLCFEKGLL
ncbi:amidohydrolase [bacterium]|nr:amidohydrolase [bacterium]